MDYTFTVHETEIKTFKMHCYLARDDTKWMNGFDWINGWEGQTEGWMDW